MSTIKAKNSIWLELDLTKIKSRLKWRRFMINNIPKHKLQQISFHDDDGWLWTLCLNCNSVKYLTLFAQIYWAYILCLQTVCKIWQRKAMKVFWKRHKCQFSIIQAFTAPWMIKCGWMAAIFWSGLKSWYWWLIKSIFIWITQTFLDFIIDIIRSCFVCKLSSFGLISSFRLL
jgi:hypothetical protein